MNKKPEKYIVFLLKLLVYIFIFQFTAVSCWNNDKSDKKGLIPEKTFISILTDSYMADGLLIIPGIRYEYSKKDSISSYIDIIKSYGYSYQSMEKTVRYYFVYNPKELIKIYDRILEKFSEMESRLKKEKEAIMFAETERAKMKSEFILPDPKTTKVPSFSYFLTAPGSFALSFSVTVFPDDLSFKPCFTARYSSADSSLTDKQTYLPTIMYIKDGSPHKYTVTGRINGMGPSILQGLYYDYENHPAECEKHVEIVNISFSYTRDPSAK